jgi:hypothetical protein
MLHFIHANAPQCRIFWIFAGTLCNRETNANGRNGDMVRVRNNGRRDATPRLCSAPMARLILAGGQDP